MGKRTLKAASTGLGALAAMLAGVMLLLPSALAAAPM